MNFRQRFEKFMYGRYGTDRLGLVLLWTALILMLVNSFINSLIIYLVELFLIGYSFFRLFSKISEKDIGKMISSKNFLKNSSLFSDFTNLSGETEKRMFTQNALLAR